MLMLTVQLFLKALIIGVVVILALLYAAEPSVSVGEDTMTQFESQPLEQSSPDPNSLGSFGN